MLRKILSCLFILLSSLSLLFAADSLNFDLVESSLVAGGEKSVSTNFMLSQGILGEIIGDSSLIETMQPIELVGTGAIITAKGTIDDNGASLKLEVDEPQGEYQAIITDNSWQAIDIKLSEGERNIIVTGADYVDNKEIKNLQVTVDTIVPSRPTLTPVTSPTGSSPQVLSGTKEVDSSIWLNGEEAVPLDSSASWTCALFLKEGDNPFTIMVKDRAENASTAVVESVYLDTIAPTVSITSPVDGSLAIQPQIDVFGTIDEDVVSLEVNGIPATIVGDTFIAKDVPLIEGWNEISATASDGAGNTFTHKISIFLDTTPPYKPTINPVTSPTNTLVQHISGIKDTGASLWLNGVEIIPINSSTTWSYDMVLVEGNNPISLYVMDGAGRTSDVENTESIFVDTSPPNTPIVIDKGVYLVAANMLSASWLSGDPETDVAEYQYGIGTVPGTRDVLEWTSTGLTQEVTNNTLGLTHRETYFFTVRALNFAGSWSEAGNSDGITVNKSVPDILNITPFTGTKIKAGEPTQVIVSASDADLDSLEYRYFINGGLVQDWGILDYYNWNISVSDFGRKNIRGEVRDGLEGNASGSETVFVVLEPVRP